MNGRSAPTLREWLREGPFALAMSSGFFGFFAHCGAMTVLEDAGLLPSRLSGASAGALVTGAWAAGIDAPVLEAELRRLKRADFWDPRPGMGLLRGGLFRARLSTLLPVNDFARCRAPLRVSTHEVLTHKTHVVDRGELAAAIHASCAVPFMFHPVRIEGRLLVDGGVSDRPGTAGMPAGARVLFHHLTSRSPWRRRGGDAMTIPQREGMIAVALDGLPRVGPFRLEQGPRAFDAARRAFSQALDRPIDGAVVRFAA